MCEHNMVLLMTVSLPLEPTVYNSPACRYIPLMDLSVQQLDRPKMNLMEDYPPAAFAICTRFFPACT